MTDQNRHADPVKRDELGELVRAAVAQELGARSPRGRSATRIAAVAVVAFGMGALAATAVLTIQEDASKAPVLALQSPAPDPVEVAANPLQVPQAADVANRPDDAPSSRPIRDVLAQPNVDASALPQDRDRYAEKVGPALEARKADERAAPEPAREPWATDRQDVRVARSDVPAEVPASVEAEPWSSDPPALAAAPSESVAAPALARVRSAVSMRAGPDRRAEVVGTVPADGPVQVVSCDGWCEVVYNGRRGFIYMTFLDGAF
jgi:Bacterial SH3 domain